MRALLQVLLLLVTLPIALGPATTTLTRFLGGEATHTCACGMKRGQCGCAECAHAEAARKDAKRASTYATFRTSCEDDDGMVRAPSLPLVAPPNDRLAVTVSTPIAFSLTTPLASLRSQLVREPSTPPPRA